MDKIFRVIVGLKSYDIFDEGMFTYGEAQSRVLMYLTAGYEARLAVDGE